MIIHVDGSPRVSRALLQDGKVLQVTTITLEGVRGPQALSVGDNGRLLASEGGQLVEFDAQRAASTVSRSSVGCRVAPAWMSAVRSTTRIRVGTVTRTCAMASSEARV